MMTNLISFLPVAIFVFCLSALAEGPETKSHGRLSDGRAYRLDERGYRLIDEMAEMEVTISDLQKKVRTLENELVQKNSELGRTEKGATAGIKPVLETSSTEHESNERYPGQLAERSVECSRIVEPLQKRISVLEQALNSNTDSGQGQVAKTDDLTQLRVENRELRTQLIAAQRTNRSQLGVENVGREQNQKIEAAQMELSSMAKSLEQKETEINSLRTLLESSNTKQIEQQKSLENLQYEIKERNEQLAMAQNNLKAIEQSKISETSAATMATAVPTARGGDRASLTRDATTIYAGLDAESRQTYQNKLQSQLTSIQQLISERKRYIDVVKGKGSGVSLSIQPLVSRSGITLDTYRLHVKEFSSKDDAARIQSGLNDIEKILKDDISTLKRLAKV